jgi:hypothetical protein
MIEVVYAMIIVIFASLGVLALFNHLVRGTELRDAQSQLDGRLLEVKSELDELKFSRDSMDDEQIALEKQARCMLDLEEKHKMAHAAALDTGKGRRDVR